MSPFSVIGGASPEPFLWCHHDVIMIDKRKIRGFNIWGSGFWWLCTGQIQACSDVSCPYMVDPWLRLGIKGQVSDKNPQSPYPRKLSVPLLATLVQAFACQSLTLVPFDFIRNKICLTPTSLCSFACSTSPHLRRGPTVTLHGSQTGYGMYWIE